MDNIQKKQSKSFSDVCSLQLSFQRLRISRIVAQASSVPTIQSSQDGSPPPGHFTYLIFFDVQARHRTHHNGQQLYFLSDRKWVQGFLLSEWKYSREVRNLWRDWSPTRFRQVDGRRLERQSSAMSNSTPLKERFRKQKNRDRMCQRSALTCTRTAA